MVEWRKAAEPTNQVESGVIECRNRVEHVPPDRLGWLNITHKRDAENDGADSLDDEREQDDLAC